MKQIQTNKKLSKTEMLDIKGGVQPELFCLKAGESCGNSFAACCPGHSCTGPKPYLRVCLPEAAPGDPGDPGDFDPGPLI